MSEYKELTATDTIKMYENGEIKDVDATVVSECHFAVFLNDSYYANLKKREAFIEAMKGKCMIMTDILPEYLQEFAIGYCAGSVNLIPEKISAVKMVDIDDDNAVSIVFVDGLTMNTGSENVDHHLAYTTDQHSNVAFSPEKIINQMKAFTKRSELFNETGAVHAAEIYDGNAVIKFIEDINKMNAVYKIIGHALTYGIDLSSCAIFSTGRVFKEMISACDKVGCRFIVSKSAPTKQAIELAMEKDITLIGFARGDSFKVYCGESRIMI